MNGQMTTEDTVWRFMGTALAMIANGFCLAVGFMLAIKVFGNPLV